MTVRVAAVEPGAGVASGTEARRGVRAFDGAMVLSVAMGLSGLLIYVFHVLAARVLGPDSYGRIAVLWAALFVAVVVLFRPLEQTTARALADRRSRDEGGASVVRAAVVLAAAIVSLLVAVLALGRDAVSSALFDGDATLTWALIAGIVVYAGVYVVRGVTSGMRWFSGYGALLLADAVARVALALPLLVVASEGVAAVAMVGAGVVGIAVTLLAGHRRLRTLHEADEAAPFPLRSATRFAGPASVIAAADQILVNGGPLLVVLSDAPGGSRAAGVVFAATMLVRVPVFLFQGLAASLLPNFTALHASDQMGAVVRAARRACAASVAVGAAAFTVALVAGPAMMVLVYGEEYRTGRVALALLGAGVGSYLAAATLSQLLLALDRGRAAAATWAGAAALFALAYAVIGGTALDRIAAAFVLAATAAAVVLGLVVARVVRDGARGGH
ncbi:MAG: lipopolysaccharide biosynthesis protein [Pseudomonadota bacterium]